MVLTLDAHVVALLPGATISLQLRAGPVVSQWRRRQSAAALAPLRVSASLRLPYGVTGALRLPSGARLGQIRGSPQRSVAAQPRAGVPTPCRRFRKWQLETGTNYTFVADIARPSVAEGDTAAVKTDDSGASEHSGGPCSVRVAGRGPRDVWAIACPIET